MASPFSRTMRSLHVDSFYVSVVGLMIAIGLAIVWGYWFFTAKVTFYETSQNLYITDKETVVSEFPSDQRSVTQRVKTTRRRWVLATFSADAMKKIRQGQPALLHLEGKIGKQMGAIPAVVTNMAYTATKSTGRVELLAEIDAEVPNPFKDGGGGEVKIEVDHVTPAVLVMRTSGLFTETPPTSSSPQSRRQSK